MSTPPPPPHTPVEVWKDYLEENPIAVGMQDSPTFDREAAYLRWLTESQTFERLGECMCLSLDGDAANQAWTQTKAWGRYLDWREATAENYPMTRSPENFAKLCGLFGVPAVMVEVGMLHGWTAPNDEYTAWSPPSPALAAAVLREAMETVDPAEFKARRGDDCFGVRAVRQHHPHATAFRLRLGPTGDWHTRPL